MQQLFLQDCLTEDVYHIIPHLLMLLKPLLFHAHKPKSIFTNLAAALESQGKEWFSISRIKWDGTMSVGIYSGTPRKEIRSTTVDRANPRILPEAMLLNKVPGLQPIHSSFLIMPGENMTEYRSYLFSQLQLISLEVGEFICVVFSQNNFPALTTAREVPGMLGTIEVTREVKTEAVDFFPLVASLMIYQEGIQKLSPLAQFGLTLRIRLMNLGRQEFLARRARLDKKLLLPANRNMPGAHLAEGHLGCIFENNLILSPTFFFYVLLKGEEETSTVQLNISRQRRHQWTAAYEQHYISLGGEKTISRLSGDEKRALGSNLLDDD